MPLTSELSRPKLALEELSRNGTLMWPTLRMIVPSIGILNSDGVTSEANFVSVFGGTVAANSIVSRNDVWFAKIITARSPLPRVLRWSNPSRWTRIQGDSRNGSRHHTPQQIRQAFRLARTLTPHEPSGFRVRQKR